MGRCYTCAAGARPNGDNELPEYVNYNAQGRLVRSYRYTGSVSDASQRLRSLDYTYDLLDRLAQVSYRDVLGVELGRSQHAYDEKGRIASSTGKDGGNVVSFEYDDMGQLTETRLGADMRLGCEYHFHVQVKSIKAARISTGALLCGQDLGYEEKVATGTAEPRYDGLITQDVVASPERLADDVNSRAIVHGNGAEKLLYLYNNASYRPDHVTGSTPLAPKRDMSLEGNFQWDADGRMVYDASRDLLIDYDATGLPTEMRRLDLSDTLGGCSFAQTQLYYVDGMEVFVTSEYTMIQGRSSVVERERPDDLAEWYVKDYQGSLALSVVGNGYGSAFAYHPYGAQNLLRTDGQPPAEQYTGKERDGTNEFYYHGARFMDPVLGMWVMPDPAGLDGHSVVRDTQEGAWANRLLT